MGLLRWLPGETLHSLVTRQHAFWGHRRVEQTAMALFGHHRKGYQHDLPGYLGELVNRTGGQLGDVMSLSLDRTLLRFYRPHLSESRERSYASAMGGGSEAHVRRRLIAASAGPKIFHPLKACLACIKEDREFFGWTYWHMDHQYPGVWICPQHAVPLQKSPSRPNRYGRIQWQCPDANCLMPTSVAYASVLELDICARFARLVCEVVDRRPIVRIGSDALYVGYLNALERHGLVTADGRVAMDLVVPEFLCHARQLRCLPELQILLNQEERVGVQVSRMLASTGGDCHPILRFVMVDWLMKSSGATSACIAETARKNLHADTDKGC